MQNDYLINKKRYDLDQKKIILSKPRNSVRSKIVDVNKLLNRIKLNEKKDHKENLILFSLISVVIGIIGIISIF
jgi:hypothetical protein